MKLAILSDVHANLEALNATLAEIERQRAEKIFFLGDAVGYGADPNKCVKIIDKLCDIKLLGNHDYVALGLEDSDNFNPIAKESMRWTQNRIKRKTIETLSNFDMEATFLDYYFVHGTPDCPSDWNYLLTPDDAKEGFEHFNQQICFVGHSHLPCVFCLHPDGSVLMTDTITSFEAKPDCRYIINVGSVGQPRDGNADACFVIANTDKNQIDFCRTKYDLERAQKKLRKAQLPEFLASRLANGK
ncbi:MAG: metallophosphoesterase family protein [Candidatus Zixiibacteriota bacterium]